MAILTSFFMNDDLAAVLFIWSRYSKLLRVNINEFWGHGKNIFRVYSTIFVEGLKKITKTFIKTASLFPAIRTGGPPEYDVKFRPL